MVASAPEAGDDVGGSTLKIGGDESLNGYLFINDTGDKLYVSGIRTGGESAGGSFTALPVPGPGPDPNDPVQIAGTYGSLILMNTGVWGYELDPDDPETKALPSGTTATDTFTYQITDAFGQTDIAEIRIEIGGTAPSGQPGRTINGSLFGDIITPFFFGGSTARADRIKGNGGWDYIDGGAGNDSIWGGNGNDWLIGGSGSDWLRGGGGWDSFVFNGPLGSSNVDTVAGFNRRYDTLVLDHNAFDGLGFGPLRKSAFYAARGAVEAHDATDRIIYDKSTGRLYFDEDGAGGTDAIHFATLTGRPHITAADFLIV